MTEPIVYEDLVARNSGYVSPETQARIRRTRLLIAGCGIGSSLAVCAARIGFERFVLIDGDLIGAHNLNRQFYDSADVGRPKVEALRDQILRINPSAQVEAINQMLSQGNTAKVVAKSDLVFDTVDFLDLPAILSLHDAAHRLHKPIFTALSVGFGALVWYFPPGTTATLASMLAGAVDAAVSRGGSASAYADVFGAFLGRLAPHLDQEVVDRVGEVLATMKDGKPCPASQVAVGSFSVAALATSMICDQLAGIEPPASPELIVLSFRQRRMQVVDLST